ncbi:MAG: hypothetical protein AAFN81_34465, partial [Bacteroidota bacterium]
NRKAKKGEKKRNLVKEVIGDHQLNKYIADYLSQSEEKPIAKTEFWDEVEQVNILTTLIFISDSEEEIDKRKEQIEKRYLRAWRKGGSVKNRESEAFQMQFLAKIIGSVDQKKYPLTEAKKKCFESLQLFFLNLDKNQ